MHGFEYAAAGHMIQMGLVKEGTRVVEAVRDRYDGERRNPWNEFECGSNYARSMASYALLNAFSGFSFDMTKGLIGFNPVATTGGKFRCFWSLDSGWGVLEMRGNRVELKVLEGSLTLKTLDLPCLRGSKTVRVRLGAKTLPAVNRLGNLDLPRPVRVTPQQALTITML